MLRTELLPVLEDLAAKMLDWRTTLELTQAEAAELAGISRTTWNGIERLASGDGSLRSAPGPDTLRGIARAVDLPPLPLLAAAGIPITSADLLDAARSRLAVIAELADRVADEVRRLAADVEAVAAGGEAAATSFGTIGPDDDPPRTS